MTENGNVLHVTSLPYGLKLYFILADYRFGIKKTFISETVEKNKMISCYETSIIHFHNRTNTALQ
jgi:hypothetical protein